MIDPFIQVDPFIQAASMVCPDGQTKEGFVVTWYAWSNTVGLRHQFFETFEGSQGLRRRESEKAMKGIDAEDYALMSEIRAVWSGAAPCRSATPAEWERIIRLAADKRVELIRYVWSEGYYAQLTPIGAEAMRIREAMSCR